MFTFNARSLKTVCGAAALFLALGFGAVHAGDYAARLSLSAPVGDAGDPQVVNIPVVDNSGRASFGINTGLALRLSAPVGDAGDIRVTNISAAVAPAPVETSVPRELAIKLAAPVSDSGDPHIAKMPVVYDDGYNG